MSSSSSSSSSSINFITIKQQENQQVCVWYWQNKIQNKKQADTIYMVIPSLIGDDTVL